MKYSANEYLEVDVIGVTDADVNILQDKLVKARKEHKCFTLGYGAPEHNISKGEMYRYIKAVVDSDYFGNYKVCLGCIDIELDGELEDD